MTLPAYLKEDMVVYDVGAGKKPYASPELKRSKNLKVIGLDIDGGELAKAPEGSYDETLVADISEFRGRGDGDLIICQTVLEHVENTEKAFRALASILTPSRLALILVPSRHALFAKLNKVLPQELKRRILFYLYPYRASHSGFRSYYDKCSPEEFRKMAEDNGFEIVEENKYFLTGYFRFFFPLHFLLRLWKVAHYFLNSDTATEVFSYVLRKR
jgi:2-polyprenyl-6-hydroxyphenyl methylase/3-demethylubiquinone-9 3-methyltransferase